MIKPGAVLIVAVGTLAALLIARPVVKLAGAKVSKGVI